MRRSVPMAWSSGRHPLYCEGVFGVWVMMSMAAGASRWRQRHPQCPLRLTFPSPSSPLGTMDNLPHHFLQTLVQRDMRWWPTQWRCKVVVGARRIWREVFAGTGWIYREEVTSARVAGSGRRQGVVHLFFLFFPSDWRCARVNLISFM
jgi:hypothetical protein